ncbi:hypothetical protein [Azonexus sp.]|uniref:hypothetical protein n=1 Tax=Azonexus sp. TaxID=1872668 RepID=UPI0027BA568B|nr:hypothetical protein [Azonexus sp.]
MRDNLRQKIKDKLESEGFSGLYVSGECACCTDDLAACGECSQDDGDEYLNGCEPGYKHVDPERPGFWVISMHKESPTQERFDTLFEQVG